MNVSHQKDSTKDPIRPAHLHQGFQIYRHLQSVDVEAWKDKMPSIVIFYSDVLFCSGAPFKVNACLPFKCYDKIAIQPCR